MTWQYQQSTGKLTHNDSEWIGYSGTGLGRNNPSLQSTPNVGPLPQGTWFIGDAHDDSHLGPCVMALIPEEDTDTFGRSGFYIHGDSSTHDASHGCIVLGPALRRLISTSPDKTLVVVC